MTDNLQVLNINLANLDKKSKDKFVLLLNRTMKECNDTDGVLWTALDDKESQWRYGFFVLTDGREVLCSVFYDRCKLIMRYTPPQHRRKGYASALLSRIGDLYATYEHLPCWIVSSKHTWAMNDRIGWNRGERYESEHKQGEYELDFVPSSCLAHYRKYIAVDRCYNFFKGNDTKGAFGLDYLKAYTRFINDTKANAKVLATLKVK